MYDHAPTILCVEMITLPGNSTNVEMIVRGYHIYQSVWVIVGKELSCQRELVS